MASREEIPPEIIHEILSQTTELNTLDKCKVVSKEWKGLIYDSSFVSLYMQRSGNVFGYFIQYMKRNKWMSVFIANAEVERGGTCSSDKISWWACHDDTRILASCNQGIVCCQKRKDNNYRWYVCKPATKQWKAMPNPKLRFRTVGVVMVVFKSQPLHYNVVRLSDGRKFVGSMKKYNCEIFDSRTWVWKEAEDIYLPYDELITKHPGISVGEFVYWQTTEDNVLELDIAHQHFRKFSLPESVCDNNAYECKRLIEYEGGLGFTCFEEDGNMKLWLRKGRLREGCWRSYGWEIKNMAYNLNVRKLNSLDYGLILASDVFQFRSDLEYVDLRGA